MPDIQPELMQLLSSQKLAHENASARQKKTGKVLIILAVVCALIAVFHPNDYQAATPCNLSERDWSCTGGSPASGNFSILLIELFVMPLVAFVLGLAAIFVYLSARAAQKRANKIGQQLSAAEIQN